MVQTSGNMSNRYGLLVCCDAGDLDLLELISDIRRLKVAAEDGLEGKMSTQGFWLLSHHFRVVLVEQGSN